MTKITSIHSASNPAFSVCLKLKKKLRKDIVDRARQGTERK